MMLVGGNGARESNEHGNRLRAVGAIEYRAELEWTLNKLINIELKHSWLANKDTLRRAIRRIGVPNEIRGKVWSILVEQSIGDKRYDVSSGTRKDMSLLVRLNVQQLTQSVLVHH